MAKKSPIADDGIQGLDWVKDDIKTREKGGWGGAWRGPLSSLRHLSKVILPIVAFILLYMLYQAKRPCAWEHPYQSRGSWLKGSLNTHTRHHGAKMIFSLYEKMGYDFVVATEWAPYREQTDSFTKELDFLAIPGLETGLGTRHLLILGTDDGDMELENEQDLQDLSTGDFVEGGPEHGYGFDDRILSPPQEVDPKKHLSRIISDAKRNDYFVIAAHPLYYPEHFSLGELDALEGLDAIEIYNALAERVLSLQERKGGRESIEGQSHLALNVWDSLLSAGRKIWGVAGDDFLDLLLRTPGDAWVMVQTDEFTTRSILSSLKGGRFYSSTGVFFNRIEAKGKNILVEIDREGEIRFVGKNGTVLQERKGISSTYTYQGNESYVRVEVEGTDGTYAWSQPFYSKREGGD